MITSAKQAMSLCWLALSLALPASTLRADDNPALPAAIQGDAITYVFECPDTTLVVRTENNIAWLFWPGDTRQLHLHASGETQAWNDDQFGLSIRGQSARISFTDHRPSIDCQNNRRPAIWEHAKLSGVQFRAVGNEPGWLLEISEHTGMTLSSDYGTQQISQAIPDPHTDRHTRQTRWEGEQFDVLIIGQPCSDSMSGERFTTSVSIQLDDRQLSGCGRALY